MDDDQSTPVTGESGTPTVEGTGTPPVPETTASPLPTPDSAPSVHDRPSYGVFLLVAAGLTVLIAGSLGFSHWRSTLPPPPGPPPQPVESADLHSYGERPPRLVRGNRAEIPARNLSVITPTIMCRGLVDLDGHVKEARVLGPRHELDEYEEAALAAFRQYEFVPGERMGKKLPAWINWPVGFADPSHPVDALRLKGSDTIGGELAPRLVEAFRPVRADLSVTVAALGSSTAFTGLFDGTADIGMASRPATSDELMRAAFLGIRLRDYVFGHDAIAVIVNPKSPVRELSMAQLKRVFNGQINNWRELGGPSLPIKRFSRPSYSGTHGFFKQRVLAGTEGSAEFAKDVGWIEKSEELVTRVAETEGAIGFIGLGWVHAKVRALGISDGAAAVAPTEASVVDHSYPITRPLLLYTRGAPGKEAADFLSFVFSPKAQQMVKAAGFVPTDEGSLVITPRTVPQRLSYELLRLHFAEGQSAILPGEKDKLARVVQSLKETENYAMIAGNADSSEGSTSAAERLADERARSVAAEVLKQVPDARIVTRADGSGQPVSSNATVKGRTENRRADVFILHRQDSE